jgi:hypothetical protein
MVRIHPLRRLGQVEIATFWWHQSLDPDWRVIAQESTENLASGVTAHKLAIEKTKSRRECLERNGKPEQTGYK